MQNTDIKSNTQTNTTTPLPKIKENKKAKKPKKKTNSDCVFCITIHTDIIVS